MAWLNIYQSLKQAIQNVIAPEMQQLRGDIHALHERMNSLEKSIDGRFSAVDKRFDAVDKRFESIDKRLDSVDKRLDALAFGWRQSTNIRERLAALEARLDRCN